MNKKLNKTLSLKIGVTLICFRISFEISRDTHTVKTSVLLCIKRLLLIHPNPKYVMRDRFLRWESVFMVKISQLLAFLLFRLGGISSYFLGGGILYI